MLHAAIRNAANGHINDETSTPSAKSGLEWRQAAIFGAEGQSDAVRAALSELCRSPPPLVATIHAMSKWDDGEARATGKGGVRGRREGGGVRQ